MVYARRGGRKGFRKFRKGRKFYDKRNKNVPLIKAIVKKQIQKNIEHKYFDYEDNPAAVGAGGFTINQVLNNIVQGIDEHMRIGTKIRVQSLLGRLSMTIDQAGTASLVYVRFMIVFVRKQLSAIGQTPADYLDPGTLGKWDISLMRKESKDDYEILYDRMFYINKTDKTVANIKFYKSIKNKLFSYDDGNVYPQGSLWIVTATSEPSADHQPVFAMYRRVNYTDA